MHVFRTLILASSLVIAYLTPASANSDVCPVPLKVRFSVDYLPFSLMTSEGQLMGIDVEFVQKLFEHLDCPIEPVTMPFKRAIIELAAGRIDMMPFASITRERRSFALFSLPYRNETAGLVVRREELPNLPIDELDDVVDLGLVLGHEQNSYRGETFKAFLKSPKAEKHVFEFVSSSEGIRMLSAGRIDAIVEMPAAVLATAREMGVEADFAEHPFRLWSEPVHFMFSRKTVSPKLITAVNYALEDLIATPEYVARYGSMGLQDNPRFDPDG
ncbi:amino acid ABC transporter substrate-binding protein [Roseibium denhamense]|uniref:Amino acid ABC transporter substrate-binding protein, PAAT family n=1 Tax=Roseibium denhamense TaxID=76305 RepID=A0ABY1P6M7_9HYPH|nr:transporter substrate-binding domain-containing protein [Roseibium denhamense]MTI07101.1 amino acid ABC transporter substrate-binding protein [Roseibium denhamense]SMP27127.1 amino acid ABC transporter substrate-binding protein, PAAT family [Roseibium denhamense]